MRRGSRGEGTILLPPPGKVIGLRVGNCVGVVVGREPLGVPKLGDGGSTMPSVLLADRIFAV